MEKNIATRRKIVKVVIWVVVLVAVLATAHILVSNFDGLEFLRRLHGG